jgi:hypothetical protein
MKDKSRFDLTEDGAIADHSLNISRMTTLEFMRFRGPDVIKSLRKGFLDSSLEIVGGVYSLGTLLILGPFVLAAWPVSAAEAVREARQMVAKEKARVHGSCEVYRFKFSSFEGRPVKCWIINLLVTHLGLHRLLSIPDYDYALRDRTTTGDLVFYRVKEGVER